MVARSLALAAAAGAAAVLVAGCGGDAKPKPSVPAGPKILHIVFPEGFTRAEMAERIDAVRRIAEQRRHVTPRITAFGYLAATASSGLASLQAAAHPARVPYLYYARKKDRKHHFFTASYAAFQQFLARNGYG